MNDKYTWIFAGSYSIAFFSILVLFHFYPGQPNDPLLGRLLDGELLILNYAFGSSVGSRIKDNLIADKKDDSDK